MANLNKNEISILIGGKAGFGIDKSGSIIARLLNRLGYRVFAYRDYPSIIRGGHTFSIIRAANNRIATHQDKIDLAIALDRETLSLHKSRLKKECLFIFDAEHAEPGAVEACGVAVPLSRYLEEEKAPQVMRNSGAIGALAKAIGIGFGAVEAILKEEFAQDAQLNIKVCRRGFDGARELIKISALSQEALPLVTGNEAVALGLVEAGLNAYIAYPMTPSSPILHYLAENADSFSLDVLHPESEIAVALMALGYSYIGKKVAVGTSGGGFCLMAEALSFSAMAELPIVIVLGQRPGPSTGLPTYSSQTELHFALSAGQGEFARLVVSPGDAEEAYYWSALALQMSWKYQLPGIILTDKNLGESVFNFDLNMVGEIKEEEPILWEKKSPYSRYALTESGISPLAFPPEKNAVIKINSYEHDESGITTEDPQKAVLMQEKRLRKEKFLAQELESIKTVNVYGQKDAQTALLCWGSNKGVCVEVGESLGWKVIQPITLHPFPEGQFRAALAGVKKLICVESNATGQLARLIRGYGFQVNKTVLKYDGRPFSPEDLADKCKNIF